MRFLRGEAFLFCFAVTAPIIQNSTKLVKKTVSSHFYLTLFEHNSLLVFVRGLAPCDSAVYSRRDEFFRDQSAETKVVLVDV